MAKINSYSKNCMGTVCFDGLFTGMRKAQEFIAYPIKPEDDKNVIKVQSDTRIGTINLFNGLVSMCPPRAGGAYAPQMANLSVFSCLPVADLVILKANIMSTASGKAGDRGIVCDNSGAIEVFGVPA